MTVVQCKRIIISVSDPAAAQAFYRDGLGLLPLRVDGEVTFLETTDHQVEVLLHHRPTTASRAAVAASFAVTDVDATTERLVAAGGTVLDSPADQPWGQRIAVLTDPDGHVLCITDGAR
jgi:predicted enzyme related to lactoylglutathione lyase